MSTISKKIFAIVTTLTVSVMLVGPGIVKAVTIDELLAQIATLQAQLLQLQAAQQQATGGTVSSAACTGITFSRNLKQGMSGSDVKCLQAILNQSADTQVAASGVGSPGNETTFFGSLTKVAAVKFQVKYAADVLTPVGLTQGTGFIGSSTRAKLTSLVAAAPATPTTPTTPTTPVVTPGPAGENKVQLAADTPVGATVAKGAQDVIFAKINFCAASAANTVSKIILTRSGIAADADFSYIKLYDGTTQIGATQALNQTTHKASFSNISLVIAANSCKVITVKASVATAATTGDTPKLGITAASDITSTVALDGVFPILSGGMTIAGISVGQVLVDAQTTPSGSIIAGGIEQAVASFKFTASSTEGAKINSITIREVGSSVDSDVSNIKLFYGSTQIGSTIASLTDGKATFDLSSAPVEVLAGASKTLTVYVDIGISTGVADRSVIFEITQYTDVSIYGTNSGGTVVARGGDSWAADTWAQGGATMDVVLGGLTIAQDTSYAPSAQTYTVGTEANIMNAFKFSAGAYEGVRITQIKLNATGSDAGSDSNVSNISLYDTDGVLIAGPAGMVSGVVTFGSYTTGLDATGLFDVAKSSNKTIIVKADIPSGASSSATLGFELKTPNSNVKADGLTSQNDLATTDISPSTTLPSTAVSHAISANGTLTISLNAASPSAATYARGVTAYTFAKFDFTSTGEDIIVSQINVKFVTSTILLVPATGDVTNVKLYDGSTLVATDPTISSGYAQFGVTLTVPKNTTKVLTVVGDIPAASTASGLRAAFDSADDVVSTGKDSGISLTTAGSWDVFANQMTKGTPTVTVKAATTPVAQTYIKGTNNAHVATFYFSASTAEDIKITSIKITSDSSTTNATSAFDIADILPSSGYTSNVKIFDGSTQIGTTQPTWTNGANFDYVTFSGLSLSIPKGTTKSIDVKLDTSESTTTPIFVGLNDSTDVSGTGISSGQTATITMEGGGIAGKVMTLGASGSLVIALDVNTPVSAEIVSGTTGNELGRWKFTASNENIKLSVLTFEVTHSAAATGTSVAGGALSTSSPNTLATSGESFYYSINDGDVQTCTFSTTTSSWYTAADVAREIAKDCSLTVTQSGGVLTITTSTAVYSLEITDYATTASNSLDNLLLGLKYGGTETIGAYAGTNDSVVKVSLYDGTTWKADAFIGAETAGKLVYNFSSGYEVEVDRLTPKVLSLKADLSNYQGVAEGSTLTIALGDSATDYVGLITAKGGSSGTTLTTTGIYSGTSATNTALTGNPMYLYSTKPTVSLASGSPSGAGSPSTAETVFKFDVANGNTGFDLNINAIRFTLSSNSTASAQTLDDAAWSLYKSTDLTTAIGSATPFVSTSTVAYGYLTVYPTAGYTVGSNSATTYVLKGYTAGMNISGTASETLTVSIASNDFYWDDSASITGSVNANQKVLNLPVTGGSLTY
ncbi:MAG: hypothetical protein V1810_04135 [Candidatus Beckwithbacteria bacterium]